MTFFGQNGGAPASTRTSPRPSATVPLIVLAVFSVGAGIVMNNWIQGWLEPALGIHPHELSLLPTPIGLLTLVVVAAGIAAAWLVRSPGDPGICPRHPRPLHP